MSDARINQQFLERGLFLSHMIYYATGEGVRLCLAVGGSSYRTERLLKTKLDEYFHKGIVSSQVSAAGDEESVLLANWIPLAVKEILGQIPLGSGDYYADLYYNLS
jgi:hypothetical protein